MHIVSSQPFVNGNSQVSEDLSSEPSAAERQAAQDLAADIRSALRRTRRLTIRQLANRWPWYFRGGGLIAEISDDPDAGDYDHWAGMTRVAVLALDIIDDEGVRARAPQPVTVVGNVRVIARTPAKTTNTRQKA